MKILITGGAGYIGSVTVKHVLDAGHTVVVFDSLELGHREAIDPRAELIVGDLRTADDILNAMNAVRPDAVVHFAAYALVGESATNPGKYFRNNDCGDQSSGCHAGLWRYAYRLFIDVRYIRTTGSDADY